MVAERPHSSRKTVTPILSTSKKRRFKPWLTLLVVIVSSALLTYGYDHVYGNSDYLLLNIAYRNVAISLLVIEAVLFSIYLLLTSPYELAQNISISISSALGFLLLLEAIGHAILGLGWVDSAPFVFRRFYIPKEVNLIRPFPAGDLHPVAGRLHLPNGADSFVNCQGDSLHWQYNSVGARDAERARVNPEPSKKRIAVIGDSFMEGYMVDDVNRCSSILESKVGLEHLNFAVNGSNPVHYYTMYKAVAKQFEHDVVVIGFLPANDFEMLDERQSYTRVDWPNYVPYWQRTQSGYKLRYSLAHVKQSIFNGHHTNTSLLRVVDSVYATLSYGDKLKADVLTHSSLFRLLGVINLKAYRSGAYTKYEQFSDEEWQYVRQSLTQLVREARGKKVILLSLPTQSDLLALQQGKQNRLDPVLANFCRQYQISFLPLVPAFLKSKQNLDELYMACDGHWSRKGEAFAAGVILKSSIYRQAIGL